MAALDIASLTHPLTQQVIASQYPNLADWQGPNPVATGTTTTTAPPVYTPPGVTPAQPPAAVPVTVSPSPSKASDGDKGYTALSQVPNVDISQFQTKRKVDKPLLGYGALLGPVSLGIAGVDALRKAGTDTDLEGFKKANLARLSSVAKLAGYSLDKRRAMREKAKYLLSQPLTVGDKPANSDKDKAAAIAKVFSDIVDPIAEQVLAAQASGQDASGSDPWAGGTDPIEMQAAISQFLAPYARNAAASAGDNAALLREMASKESSPALAQILNRQASGMAAMGDQAAYSLMQSGQYAPAVAAMQHEASLQAKIAALQNQLATQQTGGIDMSQITG